MGSAVAETIEPDLKSGQGYFVAAKSRELARFVPVCVKAILNSDAGIHVEKK